MALPVGLAARFVSSCETNLNAAALNTLTYVYFLMSFEASIDYSVACATRLSVSQHLTLWILAGSS